MTSRRAFGVGSKRQVVEELLSGSPTAGQLSRWHNISSGLIRYWRHQHLEGKLVDGPSRNERALAEPRLWRGEELERLVGRLTLENELLKKAVAHTARRRREASLPITGRTLTPLTAGLKGGARS